MKVMLIFPIWDKYGASKSGIKLALTVAEAGHSVIIFAPIELRDSSLELTHPNIYVQFLRLPILRKSKIYSHKFPYYVFTLVLDSIKLRKRIMSHEPDVIHFVTLASISPVFLRLLKYPKSVTHLSVHELPHNSLERFLFSRTFKVFDVVTANSKFVSRAFTKPINVVISPSLDEEPALSISRSEELFPEVRPVRIACVGRINAWKGQKLAFRSFIKSRLDQHGAELFFFGTSLKGEEHFLDELKSLVADSAFKHLVHFMGEIDNVVEVLRVMDILLVPSTRPEPFGKVVLEGFASGCLVIASDSGGPAELIDDQITGLLHEIGSEASLTKKIDWAVQNKEASRRIAKCGNKAFLEGMMVNQELKYLEIWTAKLRVKR